MSRRRKYIKVSFQKEGIHKFPGAKDLPGVEFLQYPHRHMFHFYVTLQVRHDDREVEFILFKRELENLYTEHALELDSSFDITQNRQCDASSNGCVYNLAIRRIAKNCDCSCNTLFHFVVRVIY